MKNHPVKNPVQKAPVVKVEHKPLVHPLEGPREPVARVTDKKAALVAAVDEFIEFTGKAISTNSSYFESREVELAKLRAAFAEFNK